MTHSSGHADEVARRTLLLATAALHRGRFDAAHELASQVLGNSALLSPANGHDGQRRHRLESQAVAVSVDADIGRNQVAAATEFADEAWAVDPVDPVVLAARVRAWEACDGDDGALQAFGLTRLSTCEPVGATPDLRAPVCLTICRDERHQLDSFLHHHRSIGVGHFVVVDNGSTDGSVEFLRRQHDVDLWSTGTGFRDLAFGAAAFMVISRRRLHRRWLLIVDADERFVVPPPCANVVDLLVALDSAGCDALDGVLVDLYDDRPFAAPRSEVPRDLRERSWLDRTWMHGVHEHAGPFANADHLVGGVRQRLFGSPPDFLLSKVPLVRQSPDRLLVAGQHDTNVSATRRSRGRAAVLHTKFLADASRLTVEAGRRQHANEARDYARYTSLLADAPSLSFLAPDESIRYTGPEILSELAIVRPMPNPPARRAVES